MPFPIAAALAALSAGGSIWNREQSKGDIARQNEYNSPVNQLARVREAGLPMAYLTGGGQGGNQSALPQTSGKDITGNIGSYVTTQMQLKQLEILKAEVELKRNESRKFQAETEYLLSGKGEDRAGTNLTRQLGAQVGMAEAQTRGANLSNQITAVAAGNANTKTQLENSKAIAEIANLIQQRWLTQKHIEGAELDNKVKTVISDYQDGMSNAQLEKLLKENGLLDKSISGKQIDNDINAIRYKIEKATEGSQIYKRDMEAAMSGLTYDRVSAEFENYNQYMEFVQMVQNEINKTPWEKIKDPIGTLRSMAAFAYTSITGLSGSSNILNHIK